QAIKLCGGVNSFGQLKPLVPTVSREAVVMANPDMLISSDENAEVPTHWQRYKHIKFVKNADFYRIDGSVMNRAGPRMVGATATLCEKIDQVRAKKSGLK
nr:cobalamin-binding protein [Oxalobacteraceae bacterium]